jgi:branched-chain amino acid transport system ATP-binding protein
MNLADPIIVLDQGSVLVEGSPEAVRADDRVIDAYLGGGGA